MTEWTYYERQQSPWGRLTPAVRWLLTITVAAFALQHVLNLVTRGMFTYYFGLSLEGLRSGMVWQLVTYMFLHGNLMHLLFNMLGLFFMGPETERAMGTRHFLVLYFLSGILGGLGWLLISGVSWLPCVGASGAVFGVIGAYAAMFPSRPVTLLLFFVVPITMKAWVMALGLGLLEFYFLFSSNEHGIANAAHLAGGLSGFVYGVTISRRMNFKSIGPLFQRRRAPALTVLDGGLAKDPSMADVDRILDKISKQGMGSLTRGERETLNRASQGLPKA